MVPTAPPVDPDHIYGDNLECQHQLCLFKDGKLKFQMVDGEMYPPSVAETQVSMKYPANVPEANQMAVGQEVFGLLPGLMMYATIWLREHNRVCDILRTEHPTWNDEQLFQTTRLILIGEKQNSVELEELYGDIDILEFYPGLLMEKSLPNYIFGESMVEIRSSYSLKGLLGNPIYSPEYWKSSTFGDETGFNIVKTTMLQRLV
ncbi:prostaglandin G/H synthase 1-like isoform X2 [Notamacropus eugenii]|uniref:prostaglandin G/H synthase 1-like isoform X2 n=1 Tax=Notamacropus eugenii TaxID=9315 RepID=UPI003B682EBF